MLPWNFKNWYKKVKTSFVDGRIGDVKLKNSQWLSFLYYRRNTFITKAKREVDTRDGIPLGSFRALIQWFLKCLSSLVVYSFWYSYNKFLGMPKMVSAGFLTLIKSGLIQEPWVMANMQESPNPLSHPSSKRSRIDQELLTNVIRYNVREGGDLTTWTQPESVFNAYFFAIFYFIDKAISTQLCFPS